MKKSEDSLRDLRDNTKPTNIDITKAPEGEKKVTENFLPERMAENFLSLGEVTH